MVQYYHHQAVISISRTYSSQITEPSYSLTNIFPFPSSLSFLLSDFMSLTFKNSTYKWNHAVFVFLCLAYFT